MLPTTSLFSETCIFRSLNPGGVGKRNHSRTISDRKDSSLSCRSTGPQPGELRATIPVANEVHSSLVRPCSEVSDPGFTLSHKSLRHRPIKASLTFAVSVCAIGPVRFRQSTLVQLYSGSKRLTGTDACNLFSQSQRSFPLRSCFFSK